MGITLTSKAINSTYDSLLKLSDNDQLTGAFKVITDGLGNDTGISINNTNQVNIAGQLVVNSSITANSFVRSGGLSTQFLKADGSVDSNTYQNTNQKGIANGYAPLDSGAKISEAYLPDSIVGQLEYQGTWNASTNTPTLPSASTVKGHYYVTSVAGTYETIEYAIGDWIISNGTSWEKVDNTDAVTTVFGRIGAIVANENDYSTFYHPLNGDLAANASTATTLQTARFINGTSFNGSANITTAIWGTSRTITIGDTGKSLNGSTNVTWTRAELGITKTNIDALNIDADTLDGFDVARFIKTAYNHSYDWQPTGVGNFVGSWHGPTGGGDGFISLGSTTNKLNLIIDGDFYAQGSSANRVWHAGNDGSGSGLDADTLDGYDSSVMWKKGADIPSGADLNTYTTDGYYHQNSNASAVSGTNYPQALAGMLSVQSDGAMVYQTYQVYDSASNTYRRGYYSGTWYSWKRILMDNDNVNADTLDGLNSTQFLRSDTSDTMSGTLTVNNDIIIKRGGVSYKQPYHSLYVGGDTLDDADTAIYIGSRGDGSGYGYEFFYEGTGTGNNNKFKLISENLGTPKVAFEVTPDGDVTFPNNVVVEGSINIDAADLSIGAANIIFDTESTLAVRGLIWDVDGAFLSKIDGGGTNGGLVEIYTNLDGAITTGDVFRIKQGSSALTAFSMAGNGYVNIPNRLAIGKTTAPATTLDVLGGILASGSISTSSGNISAGSGYMSANEYKLANSTNNGRFIGSTEWGTRHITDSGYIQFGPANTNWAHIYTDRPAFYFDKELYVLGAKVWNAGNDGSGSGLNADLLDGVHGSQFLRSDVDDTMIGVLNLNGYIQNNPSQGEWYSQIPHSYIGGVSYFKYIKIANLISATSTATIEYIIKRDYNYPGVVKGTIQVSSFSSASMSVQHDQTTGNGQIGPEVYIDNNRDVWIRGNGASWTSFIRWRAIQNVDVAILDGSTNQTTQPANSVIISPGYSKRFAWNNTSSVTEYSNINTFKDISTVGLIASGAVGIGTTSPASGSLLDVNGDIKLAAGAKIKFNDDRYFSPENNIDGAEISANGIFKIKTGATPVERFRIDSSGNVGIGTSSPGNKLTIQTGSSGDDILPVLGANGGKFSLLNNNGAYGLLQGVLGTGNSFIQSQRVDGTAAAYGLLLNPNGGNVGIGTSSPQARLDVVGNGNAIQIRRTGGFPSIKAHSDSGGHLILDSYSSSDSVYLQNYNSGNVYMVTGGGNVGIGTTLPTSKLTIIGVNNTEQVRIGHSTQGLFIKVNQENVDFNSSGNVSGTHTFSTGNVERMRIDSSGAVLIGNGVAKIDTATRLQVSGSDSGVTAIWSNADDIVFENNNNFGITLATPNTGAATIAFADPEAVNEGFIQYVHGDDYMRFATNQLEQMRITSDGRLGIGTTSPATPIHILSSTDIATFESSTTGLYNTYKNSNKVFGYVGTGSQTVSGGGVNDFGIQSSDNFLIATGGNVERMRIDGSGNVGIGTTSPQAELHIYGAQPYIYITNTAENGAGIVFNDAQATTGQAASIQFNSGSETLGFFVNDASTERVRIQTNGDTHFSGDVVAYSTSISDERLKDNIETIPNALDKVNLLRGVSYVWNKGSRKGQKDLGLIAQEVEKVLPEIVREKEMSLIDDSGIAYKTVDYEKMVGVLIEAIKEQQQQIDELKKRLDGVTN